MGGSAIIVGSGAGGSVAAWALATAGYEVLILEKGRNLLPGLGTAGPIGSLFGNDEVKAGRFFENQDIVLEPRSARSQSEAEQGVARSFVGDVNTLPTVVGGGTVHWDAKTPRFWRQDFKGRSLYGPVPDANVADWPLTYDDLAPFYDEIVGEDMPQLANRVDLDPDLRDVYGFPVPRITHSAHRFELAASAYFGPELAAVCQAAPGALTSFLLPVATLTEATGPGGPFAGLASTAHIMGTARMGDDPDSSVLDAFGRVHELDNLYVADGSVFVSSGGFNPTLTIMALSLRMARHLAGA